MFYWSSSISFLSCIIFLIFRRRIKLNFCRSEWTVMLFNLLLIRYWLWSEIFTICSTSLNFIWVFLIKILRLQLYWQCLIRLISLIIFCWGNKGSMVWYCCFLSYSCLSFWSLLWSIISLIRWNKWLGSIIDFILFRNNGSSFLNIPFYIGFTICSVEMWWIHM